MTVVMFDLRYSFGTATSGNNALRPSPAAAAECETTQQDAMTVCDWTILIADACKRL